VQSVQQQPSSYSFTHPIISPPPPPPPSPLNTTSPPSVTSSSSSLNMSSLQNPQSILKSPSLTISANNVNFEFADKDKEGDLRGSEERGDWWRGSRGVVEKEETEEVEEQGEAFGKISVLDGSRRKDLQNAGKLEFLHSTDEVSLTYDVDGGGEGEGEGEGGGNEDRLHLRPADERLVTQNAKKTQVRLRKRKRENLKLLK